MSEIYGFRVVQKANQEEMRAIAWALDMMGIKDHKEFMRNYTTTIGTTVYVNFKIGKGTQAQLISQVKTCVHETQHVIQYLRNPGKYVVNYLRSDAARAHYEVDAYRTTMEMHYFFYGTVLSSSKTANLLRVYAVSEWDIHVAKKHLRVTAQVLRHGVIMSGVSKDSIRWWRGHNVKGNRVAFVS
jgi:hypothetical protein